MKKNLYYFLIPEAILAILCGLVYIINNSILYTCEADVLAPCFGKYFGYILILVGLMVFYAIGYLVYFFITLAKRKRSGNNIK